MSQILLGKQNRLQILREVDFGLYLDAGEVGEVLLPKRYVPQDAKTGDFIDVFLYLDSEERLVATTRTPLVQVNQFACLRVSWTNKYGAFLDWGLMKDLFCPFAEQKEHMQQGQRHVVYCYIDPVTYRIVASAKVEKFLSKQMPQYQEGQPVDILVQQHTDLGYKAIVDNQYGGMIFQNEIFQPLHVGQRLAAYVKQVRPDGKIDLRLQNQTGRERVDDFSAQLLAHLQQAPGHASPLHDKSDAQDIYNTFGVSKKTFKRAVGDLYKRQLITLHPDGIRLTVAGITAAAED